MSATDPSEKGYSWEEGRALEPARELEPQPDDNEDVEPPVDLTAPSRSRLTIYLASGKAKHPRNFWLHEATCQVSWGKSFKAKKCKTETLMRVVDQPKIPNAKELFEDMDADSSGRLDKDEVAQLYKKARGQKLRKSDLTAAMKEMDDDNSGEVDLSEFESWWSRNGGDLESQRSKAFTLVFQE